MGDEGGRGVGGVEMRGSVPVIRFLSLSHPSADPTETWRPGKTKSSNTFLNFLANLDHALHRQISSCKRVHNLKLSFHNLSFLHKHIIEPVKLITHSLQTNLVAKLKGFFSLLDISTHFPDTSIDSKKRFSDQIKFQIHCID